MLGKGLESLIPNNQSNKSNNAQQKKAEPVGLPNSSNQNNSTTDNQPQNLSFLKIDENEIKENNLNESALADNWTISQKRTFEFYKLSTINEKDKNYFRKESDSKKDIFLPIRRNSGGENRFQTAIFHIEVEKIKPNSNQPRRYFSEESIKELAESIREFGILQPLVVTKKEKEGPEGLSVEYELIAGERRLLAAKLLGMERVPVIIRNIELEREKLEMAIIENIQRENLNPIEVARAFTRLQEEFRLTQREIAARLGKSRETIANIVRLLDLPPVIQKALEEGKITESHGRLLLAIENPANQLKLFEELVRENLTTRELKNRIKQSISQQKIKQEGALSPEIKMLQEKLSAELGTPVKIHQSGNSGKITISFYSSEELNNIVSRLTKDNLD